MLKKERLFIMEIGVVSNYKNDENCYIVRNGDRAFAIDPGSDADVIIEKARNMGAKITDILVTHCHYDHIWNLEELREKTGAKLWATREADENMQNDNVSLMGMFDDAHAVSPAENIVSDGEVFEVAGIKVKCIKTPGHTSCSTCFLVEKDMFCGDTLFLRSVGRWDLPTGDYETLCESIQKKVYTLCDDIKLYSGHGRETSIGYEKKFNIQIREDDRGNW